MKITKVAIQNFKCFSDETFDLDSCTVVSGPNDSGKTTLLQAIAAWHLALMHWWELNDYQRHGGAYTKAPIARQEFYSVPLRAFSLLWHQQNTKRKIIIEVTFDGLCVPVEIASNTTEQIYVRPLPSVLPDQLKDWDNFPKPVFVPAMTGLGIEEPVYQPPKIEQLLGQGKSGDVLRNLLVEASYNQDVWESLTESIKKIFGDVLLPPNAYGPSIIAEYQHRDDGKKYDIASAGSGFLQVVMLLTFLKSRPGTVLLMDKPDAHLHVILQDRIYSELRAAAQENKSQLIISTHSEVIINAAEPRELCTLSGELGKLAVDKDEAELIFSLPALSNQDISLAREKGCVFYLKGHTDLDLLRIWARTLGHPAADFLEQPFWKPAASEARRFEEEIGEDNHIEENHHFESLQFLEKNIRGVQVIERGRRDDIPAEKLMFNGKLLRLCWCHREIESYLIHPEVLTRFIGEAVSPTAEMANGDAMRELMRWHMAGDVVDNPLQENIFLESAEVRTEILPKILHKAGLPNFPYTRYAEIARIMRPDEIRPEIKEKLDAIAEHLKM